jgi:very-long-chain ceramide synthase
MQWVIKPGAYIHNQIDYYLFEFNSESSFKLLCIPIILYTNWELLAPLIAKDLPNPFAPLLFISHPVPTSPPDDRRYQKGYLDLVFVAYFIVVWSFVRQTITVNIARPFARRFGIRKEGKLDRFGEQLYAVVYFTFFGIWGVVSERQVFDE